MNTNLNPNSESRVAAGIKAAALVAIVGLVAAIAQPSRMSDDVFHAQATPAQATASAGADTPYFPARFPAPTAAADEAPTF